ncbi:MAG: tRNA uridine-5-carboxymethylaminomethyl(34) synthesis GTPase MnmE [Candidatus Cloacimonetes bacterium]|nr:tRNA uridine-5-carboxymethylaminomethyl(34) synthesis GTPase MnmE [Candidatus Cloacimonadota bacterium]
MTSPFKQLEPICAQITPVGHAAITVLRISGQGAIDIVAHHFEPAYKLLNSPSHQLIHGVFYNEQKQPLDDVLLSVFRSPNSYTGEDTVEISCHGNPHLANRVIENLLLRSRLAKPGEFTLRAYLNGKLDLSQAEAVNDLIHAQASKSEQAALMQLQGILSQHLQGILTRISDARLRCELAIDFADQDLPQIDLVDLRHRIQSLLQDTKQLADKGEQGKHIREGIKICLAGAPNSGKSSLFNAFLQQNRAIVTPHPGTTRDYLEESISLNGFPIVIYDTAGLRSSIDEVESAGIAKSYELMHNADLIILLVDSSALPSSHPSSIPAELSSKTITVFSKSDLLPSPITRKKDKLYCSANSPDGLDDISNAILDRLMLDDKLLSQPLVTNARHLAALAKCNKALQQAIETLDADMGFEFIAFELIAASHALEEILGVVSTDELLESIFSNFCIGK